MRDQARTLDGTHQRALAGAMSDSDNGDLWGGVIADPVSGAQSQGVMVTHSADKCAGEFCCLHNPSDHHMRDWPTVWRSDRYLMERTCGHGCGHPDPDHIAAVRRMFGDEFAAMNGSHGCCGCCRPSKVPA